jgi:hypothetical protein
MFILSAENFYRLIKKSAVAILVLENQGRNKTKSTQLISYNDKLNPKGS